jgi:hypothetical protein
MFIHSNMFYVTDRLGLGFDLRFRGSKLDYSCHKLLLIIRVLSRLVRQFRSTTVEFVLVLS